MKKTIFLLMLLFTGTQVKAQIAILQNTINKLESYKNFRYEYIIKQKEQISDTTVRENKFALLKMPENKELGYFFKNDNTNGANLFTNLYYGESVAELRPKDNTYRMLKKPATEVFRSSALGQLNWVKGFLDKNPTKIKQAKDTIYNRIDTYHLIVSNKDTVIDSEHLYVITHLFIDKKTLHPVAHIMRGRNNSFGKEITTSYTEHTYLNFKINETNLDASSFKMPQEYHLPDQKPEEQAALLTVGTMAPNWTLYDTEGKKTSLSQLKGKVVLLDFFFVGCLPCMYTLEPLDKLHAKYKRKNVVILSISDRDNKKLVTVFKKAQKIKNQMYPNGNNVAKQYNVKAAPVFYFVDQQGKIASVVEGYEEGFEKKMTGIIDNLIKS